MLGRFGCAIPDADGIIQVVYIHLFALEVLDNYSIKFDDYERTIITSRIIFW